MLIKLPCLAYCCNVLILKLEEHSDMYESNIKLLLFILKSKILMLYTNLTLAKGDIQVYPNF